MRIGKIVGRLVALVLLSAGQLAAQVCAGSPSLRDSRFRAAASIASYAYATALGVSFTTGKQFYGTLGGGTTYDTEQDARTYDLSITGAADVTDSTGRIYFCPLAAISLSLGPYEYLLSQTDYRYVDVALGAGVAVVAVRSTRFTAIPSLGLRIARITVSQIPSEAARQAGQPGWTQGDTYKLWTAGVGLVFGQSVTVRPEFTMTTGLIPATEANWFAAPFGRDENDVSIGLSLAITFGRRSR